MDRPLVGIDPGKDSGAVRLAPDGSTEFFPWQDPFDVAGWAAFIQAVPNPVAVVELVTTTPGMGVVSAGNFIANYRSWGLALRFYNVPTLRVTPPEWMSPYIPMGMSKKDRKTRLHELAKSYYGKMNKSRADAYMIATFGRLEYDRFFNSTEPGHARSRARVTLGF